MTDNKLWNKRLRATHPRYNLVLTGGPSSKSPHLADVSAAIEYRLATYVELYAFSATKGFLNRRFKAYTKKQKALVKIGKKLLGGTPGDHVVVGYGDWSQQDGFGRGHQKAPVKMFRKALARQVRAVVDVDEYHTSKMCSKCGMAGRGEQKLAKALLPFKKNRHEAVRNTECYHVLRCKHSACKTLWQRDQNAARNIMAKFLHKLTIGVEPAWLRRGGG